MGSTDLKSRDLGSPFVSTERLAQEWDDFAARTGALFIRPGWVAAWWRAFGVGELRLRVLRKDGQLVALIPVASDRGVIRSVTNYHTPEFGMLAEDNEAAVELARSLFAGRPRRVSIAALNPVGASFEAFRRAAGSVGYKVVVRPFQRSPYLEIAGDWTDYESRLRPSLIADVRRSRRRLAVLGKVSVEVVDGRERLEALLDEAFAVEASGWKSARGTAIQSRANVRRFYTEVARWAVARNMFRLFFLRLDHRPVAMYYALEERGVWHLLKGGYDEDYRRFSPGKQLMHAVVRHCFSAGSSRVEFHGDADPYKLEWTVSVREQQRFEAFARSPAGQIAWAARAFGRPAARRVLELVGPGHRQRA